MLIPIRFGAATVQISTDDQSVTLPSLGSLVFTVCTDDPLDNLVNDSKVALVAATDYQVMLGLLGTRANGKGYQIGQCSPGSGIIQVTAGQGIKITATALPSNAEYAGAVGVFLRKGTATTWKLAEYAYIDPGAVFEHVIQCEADDTAPSFTTALLQSTSSDNKLGDQRSAVKGYTFETIELTQGGVTINYDVTNVSIDADQIPQFDAASARAVGAEFSSLSNSLKKFVQAAAGNYYKTTGSGGRTLEFGQQGMAKAAAKLSGNKPIKIQLPADGDGPGETLLFLGNLGTNQSALQALWSKSATTPVKFTLSAAPQDSLMISQHTAISFRAY